MKKNELVFPEKYVELTSEEMEQVEGGAKDLIDHICDFLGKLLAR